MLLFHARTISRDSENIELALVHLMIEKHIRQLCSFLVWYFPFFMPLGVLLVMKKLKMNGMLL